MSVSGNASYCNEDFKNQDFKPRKEIVVYDLAKAILNDRRHSACMERLASSVPARDHSVQLGKYRLTVSKKNGRTVSAV